MLQSRHGFPLKPHGEKQPYRLFGAEGFSSLREWDNFFSLNNEIFISLNSQSSAPVPSRRRETPPPQFGLNAPRAAAVEVSAGTFSVNNDPARFRSKTLKPAAAMNAIFHINSFSASKAGPHGSFPATAADTRALEFSDFLSPRQTRRPRNTSDRALRSRYV